MGDRSGSLSQVRMSEDKVCRKDLCGSMRAVYVLEKLPDVSGPSLVDAGHYNIDILQLKFQAIWSTTTSDMRITSKIS